MPRVFLVRILFRPQWRSIFHTQAYRPKRRIDAAAGYRGLLLFDLLMLPNWGLACVVDINIVG